MSVFVAEDLTYILDTYNKQRDQWFEEMVTSTLTLERHEAGRINNIKSLLSRYTKLLQDTNTKGNEVIVLQIKSSIRYSALDS